MKYLKRVLALVLILVIILLGIFLIGRYGWKLLGFSVCESAGIEKVNVEEDHVRIRGFYPGSFPRGFLGYHAEEVDGKLYVGFKFSGLFGIFETGDFDITIPVKGEISEVIIKTKNYEYPVWPELGSTEDLPTEPETGAFEDGLYVMLERSDVYSVNWHFESKSGGITNADHSAMNTGEYLYLDNDIQWAAGNLERPVPFLLVFSDSEGNTIAQANMLYDPENPVLFVTLTSDGKILANCIEVEEPAIPVPYEPILSQYQTAISEGWGGQQLVDVGLNYMIRDVESGTVGYTVDDLDGDGIPEFAIGTLSGDEFYGKLIFALYTQDENGNAVQLFSSTERNRFYYAGGIRFANIGSSAYNDSFVTTLKLEDKGLVDMTYTTDPSDYVQMELTTFLQYDNSAEMIAEVSENQDISSLVGEDQTIMVKTSVDEWDFLNVDVVSGDSSENLGNFSRLVDAYAVKRADTRSFLIVTCDYMSDDFVTFVYEVTEGHVRKCSELNSAYPAGELKTASRLEMIVVLDVLGTYAARMDYIMDEEGNLLQTREIFTVDTENVMTVIRELPVTVNGEKALLDVGTQIVVTGTNNIDVVYFRVVDGNQTGTIQYALDPDDPWIHLIEDITEYQYLEGIPYAG